MPNQKYKPDGKALLSPTLSSRCGRRGRRRLSAVHLVAPIHFVASKSVAFTQFAFSFSPQPLNSGGK